MDIAQLTRFVAVAEHGSFRLAAEALGLSQPSVSWSIQQLEMLLGAELIERGPRGAKLTDLGEILLPRAKLVISETQRALSEFNELKRGREATINIGVSPAYIRDVFPKATAALVSKHPQLVLRVTEAYTMDLLEALRIGEIDMAFCGFPPNMDTTGLVMEETCRQRYVIAARPTHPIFDGRAITNEELLQHPWVMFDRASIGPVTMLRDAGFPTPEIAVHTRSMHYIRATILNSDLIGYLPQEFIRPDVAAGTIRELRVSMMEFESPAGIVERAEGPQTKAIRALKAEIRAACEPIRAT